MKMPGFTAGASLYDTSGHHHTLAGSFDGPTTGATVLLQVAIPEPEPGCWFNGTACYGFLQRCKYCCSGWWQLYQDRVLVGPMLPPA